MKALYRQWRPRYFHDVIGQDPIIKILTYQVHTGKISHAYLFSGSRGTGKTSTAKIFACAINCLDPQDGEPCRKCANCLAAENEESLDIVEIDAASNNSVDEIRDLREKIKYPPQMGAYRVYIIDEVHMLSQGAFNALLKTLEEPPKHAVFILATTEPQKLPATVLSRCQRYEFKRIPAAVLKQHLAGICEREKIEIDNTALDLIVRAAEGGARDAIGLLDMCRSNSGARVTVSVAEEVLGTANQEIMSGFVEKMVNYDVRGAIEVIDTLMRDGKDPGLVLKDTVSYLRSLILAQTCEESLPELLEITDSEAEVYKVQSGKVTRERLITMIDHFVRAENEVRWVSQPRIALELAALRTCMPETVLQTENLIPRIEKLEKMLENGTALRERVRSGTVQKNEMKPETGMMKEVKTPEAEKHIEQPRNSDKLWEEAMNLLKDEPSLRSMVTGAHPSRIEENTLYLMFDKENEYRIPFLEEDQRLEKLEKAISQCAGHSMTLRLCKESTNENQADELFKQIIEKAEKTFGRDKLIIEN